MKKLFFLGVAFLLTMNLLAQGDQPVVILSTTGKIALISEGKSKARPVQSGAVAKPTGQLKLTEGAKATILCNGQFKEVSGAQTTALSSLCDSSGTRKRDIDIEFAEKVMAAVDMVGVAKQRGDGWGNAVGDPKKSGDGWGNAVGDPKKSGDGWGNAVGDPKKSGDGWGNAVGDPKKSGDGWGGKGSAIRLILPGGIVLAGNTTFSWSKPANTEPYQLSIRDDSGKVIHTLTTRDTFSIIDLKSLNLNPAQIYRWKVTVGGNKPIESNEFPIEIGTEQELSKVSTDANTSMLAKDPILAGLVEAVALEKESWNYAAHQLYISLEQKENSPMVRMMHAAFWMRHGFKRLAEKTAQGK